MEGNIFQPLMPKNDEEEKCAYPEEEYNANVENMVALEKFVNENPFTINIRKEVEGILKELAKARRGDLLVENVAALIATRKDEKDEELQTRQGQNQSNLQNRRKLIQHLRDYVKYSRSFAEQKVKLTEMNRSFTTKEVKATGHTLYIENTFKFNEEVLMEVLNKYLNHHFRNMDDVVPKNMYQTKFKQRPKVSSYRELGDFIYEYR